MANQKESISTQIHLQFSSQNKPAIFKNAMPLAELH